MKLMADIEKINKGLESCSRTDGKYCGNCPYTNEGDCVSVMSKDVLALLKEQEAVEPIPFFTETGEESKNYVVCGHCKSINSIMPKATKQKYCHECGHPVLWECR